MARNDPVPNPAVRRLSLYLRQLESFKRDDRRTISSKQLGESLNLTDAQVRKDFTYFGQFGRPGIGYRVEDLIVQMRKILGTDQIRNVLLIGAGNLGRALMAYNGFDAKGFHLVAVFDIDPAKIGNRQSAAADAGGLGNDSSSGGHLFNIHPISELKGTVDRFDIRLAILAVPPEAAQDVADQVIEAGVKGILNFAPVTLTVPRDVALNTVDLAVQLEQLSFQVNLSPARNHF